MCPFYNAQLFEITGTTKGVFTHPQSSCHIAKVVLAFGHDSRQIAIASDAPPPHTSRGFLHWRFAYAGPGARRSTFMGPASENLHISGPTMFGSVRLFQLKNVRLTNDPVCGCIVKGTKSVPATGEWLRRFGVPP